MPNEDSVNNLSHKKNKKQKKDKQDKEVQTLAHREDSRIRLIKSATTLFIQQGYHGTSMSVMAHAAGMKKSSIFYHFKSKAAILTHILVQFNHDFNVEVVHIMDEKSNDPATNLQRLIDVLQRFFASHYEIVMIATLGAELANTPQFAAYFQAYLQALQVTIETTLQPFFDATSERTAQLLARDSIAFLQGMLVTLRIEQDMRALEHACQRLFNAWRTQAKLGNESHTALCDALWAHSKTQIT